MENRYSNIFAPSINRVADAMLDFQEKEVLYKLGNPLAASRDKEALQIKAHYYSGIREQFRKGASAEEKITLKYLKSEMAAFNAQLRPNWRAKLWQSRFIKPIRNWLSGNYASFRQQTLEMRQHRDDLVLKHNISTLSTAFKQKGFTHDLKGPLKRMLQQGQSEFFIRHYEISQPDTDYVLHCKRLPGSDVYYFEAFQAISRPRVEDVAARKAVSQRHTFQLNDDELQLDAKQAANLINGRSVKTGENNWLYYDALKSTGKFPFSNKFFDLLKAIEELPFKISDHQLTKLVGDLEKGMAAQWPRKQGDNSAGNYLLQADARCDTIHVTDKKGEVLDKSQLTEKAVQQQTEKAQKIVELGEKIDNGVNVSLQPAGIRFKN